MGVGWGSGPLGAATRCPRRRRPFHFFSRLGLFWRFGRLGFCRTRRRRTKPGYPQTPLLRTENRQIFIANFFFQKKIWRQNFLGDFNELTLVQPGLSYFTPSGPSLAPCLPAGDLKKPSRCRAPREPWWWAPAVESADSGEHCSWYVQTTDEPYPRVGQPRAAVVRAAHPGHGPQHPRLCQCLRVSRHKASPDEKTQPQGRREKPTCCA